MACSDPAPEPPVEPEDACAAYAATVCEREQACGAGWFEVEHGTREACEQREVEDCGARRDAEGSGLTDAVLGECRDALAAATCTTVLDYELSRCEARGARVDQNVCLFDDQCAGGNCHRELNSDLCGSCRTLGEPGAACSQDPDNGESCGPGLQCIGSPGTCQAAAVSLAGETCEPSTLRRCASSLFCNAQFVCVAQLAAEAPCTELLGECDLAQRLFCDPEVSRCRPIPIHGVGESCLPVGDPGGAACGPGLGCGPGFVCRAPLELGEPCDHLGTECGPGLGCAATATCVSLSDLTCAGGAIDPGDEGGGGQDFVFDIPPATSLVVDCGAGSAALAFIGRYGNHLEVVQEARLESVSVDLGVGPALAFTVTPATSGPVDPGMAIAVAHSGTAAVSPAICAACPAAGALTVVVTVAGASQSASQQVPVTCTVE